MFKTIEEYPNYEISESGLVRNKITGKTLKPFISGKGYLRINVGESKPYVHRLVAETYIPNTNDLPCINHKDENKLNNCVDNLEWCTIEYNNNYGSRHIDIPEEYSDNESSGMGENGKRPIVLIEDGAVVKRWESIAAACRETGRDRKTIYEGLRRKNSKWRYA